MSPERNQNLKTAVSSPSMESETQRRALPSWETVNGTLKLRTHNDLRLRTLYLNNRQIIREYYDAQFDIASKKGSDKLNEFTEKYKDADLSGVPLGEQTIFGLRTHFKMIRQSLGLERRRTTKGFAKHKRNSKAEQRRE